MSYVRDWARPFGVGSVGVWLMVACGGPGSTPFYDAPPSTHERSSASTGGDTTAEGATGGTSVDPGATGGSPPGSGGAGVAAGAGTGSAAAGGTAGEMLGGSAGTGADRGSGGDAVGGESGSAGDASGGEAGAAPVDCSSHGATAQGFDGHCYAFHADQVTWKKAGSTCDADGAHLVTISSEGRTAGEFLAENAFVWKLAGAQPTWIDATDGKGPRQPGDGTYYKWVTGEPMAMDNWTDGQPNNSETACDSGTGSGNCYEHCGFLWSTAGREMDAVPGWSDRFCDHTITFVCEWDG
jgi:hypothetical protein